MHRFRRREEAVALRRVLERLPAMVRGRLAGVRIVTEHDPAFLGIHGLGRAGDGRSYRSTSHCVWPGALMHRPASDRITTIFLQDGDAHDPKIVLHELGHALDFALGWYREPVVPLGRYAARSRREAFATAFQAWATREPTVVAPGFHDRTRLLRLDPRTAAFFDRLGAA